MSELSELTALTATLDLQGAAKHHHRVSSGSITPPSTDSSGAGTPETSEYELEVRGGMGAPEVSSDCEQERETKGGLKRHLRRACDSSERRTVFIPNLPRDATERELRNMCAFADGFLKVQLYDQLKEGATTTGATTPTQTTPTAPSTPVPGEPAAPAHTHFGCFILFSTPAQALAARDRLHGLVFDAQASPAVVLQARIAIKNLFLTREESNELAISAKPSRRNSAHGHGHAHVIPPMHECALPPTALALAAQGFSPLIQAATPPFQPYSNAHSGYASPALTAFTAGSLSGYYTPQQHALSVESGANSPHQQGGVFAAAAAAAQLQTQQYVNGGYLSHPYSSTGFQSSPQAHPHAPHTHTHHHRGHSHGPHGHGIGPYNPPCTTLFLARLESVSNEELLALLVNSFPTSLREHKFLIDSKGQRIAFVDFDTLDSAAVALQRINGYLGLACQFSKNPLNKRL